MSNQFAYLEHDFDTLAECCKSVRVTAYNFMCEVETSIQSGRFDMIEDTDKQNLRSAIACLSEAYAHLDPDGQNCPACEQEIQPF